MEPPSAGFFSQIITTRSGSRSGRERSRTASTTLKTAAFAPMPRARTAIVVNANPGDFRSMRRPNRRSARKFVMLSIYALVLVGIENVRRDRLLVLFDSRQNVRERLVEVPKRYDF